MHLVPMLRIKVTQASQDIDRNTIIWQRTCFSPIPTTTKREGKRTYTCLVRGVVETENGLQTYTGILDGKKAIPLCQQNAPLMVVLLFSI